MKKSLSRREFLRVATVAAAGGLVAACAPTVVKETVVETVEVEVAGETVKETVVVEVEGEAVKETVVVEVPAEPAVAIQFWTMNYGDVEQWVDMFEGWAGEFQAESGVTVDIQVVNWAQAMTTLLLVSQGGAHPDVADMFWLYSFTELGGGEYGPMPITEYQPILWPDLEDRFFAALEMTVIEGHSPQRLTIQLQYLYFKPLVCPQTSGNWPAFNVLWSSASASSRRPKSAIR